MNHEWKTQAFRDDPEAQSFIEEERLANHNAHQGAGLFVQEFLNSPDAMDTSIHKIFRPLNFRNPILAPGLADERMQQAWENMRPALTLATRFLTDPQFRGFWYHLMYGTPVTDAKTKKEYLQHSDQEDDLETARTDFAALLEHLADRITYYWRPENKRLPAVGVACATFWRAFGAFIDTSPFDRFRKPNGAHNSFIGLSSMFLYNLISENAVTYRDINSDIRLQWNLAVTLTHELAHTIYIWRHLPVVKWPNGGTEILASDTDSWNEIGWSCENYIWNGVVVICSFEYNAISEPWATTWENLSLNFCMCTPVTDSWLKSLFMQNSWKDVNRVLNQLSRPVGRPHRFVAQRWIDHEQDYERVQYVDGFAIDPKYHFLNEREGPVTGDVDTWFKHVRELDMGKAVETGLFMIKEHFGMTYEVCGRSIIAIPTYDEDTDEAEDGDSEDDEGSGVEGESDGDEDSDDEDSVDKGSDDEESDDEESDADMEDGSDGEWLP